MKPMKKQASKAKVAEAPVANIKKYFKTAPNVRANGLTVCVGKESNVSDSKAFYVQAVKDRLKSYDGKTEKENANEKVDTDDDEGVVEHVTNDGNIDQNSKCTGALGGENDDRERDAEAFALLRKKYVDLKKSHVQLCVEHCELSMKYKALLAVSKDTVPLPSTSSDVSDSLRTSPTDDTFTATEIIVLESFPLDKKKDSTFILKCVEFAYKENPSSLVNKTLRGTLERIEIQDGKAVAVRPAKDPLTPEKVKKIENLFIKRVTKSKCLAGEFVERIKTTNINRLIASAISNISNKEQPKGKASTKNNDLDL